MNHDLSLFKNWALTEHKKLQFRWSMYNFLNHPLAFFQGSQNLQLNFVNGVLDKNTLDNFGTPALRRGRRLMQFAFKFMF